MVLGAARALFEAAAGLRPITKGSLRVAERDPVDALRAGAVASAPLDPPLPPGWTVREYVQWSARLSGQGGAPARGLADDAIARLALGDFAKMKLNAVTPAGRRGTVVAAALATGAGLILLEDPAAGLAPDVARAFSRVVVRAVSDWASVVFGARAPLDSPFALVADEALVIDGAQVAARGAPAEIAASEGAFLVRVGGDAEAFVQAMEARGGKVLTSAVEPARACVTIELGTLGTLDVLRIAAESNALVLELRPLARVFA